eukprot:354678-Chlamydomonas_euryale.AAC.3
MLLWSLLERSLPPCSDATAGALWNDSDATAGAGHTGSQFNSNVSINSFKFRVSLAASPARSNAARSERDPLHAPQDQGHQCHCGTMIFGERRMRAHAPINNHR